MSANVAACAFEGVMVMVVAVLVGRVVTLTNNTMGMNMIMNNVISMDSGCTDY